MAEPLHISARDTGIIFHFFDTSHIDGREGHIPFLNHSLPMVDTTLLFSSALL
jgi:hypothetical protein